MKTKLAIVTIVIAMVALFLAATPVIAREVQAVPPPAPELAYVDFNGTFPVAAGEVGTVVPITSNIWSVIEDRSTILSFANDRIYVSQPDARVVVSGRVECTQDGQSYIQISIIARKGNGQSVMTAAAPFKTVAGSSMGTFALPLSRSFTDEDFSDGDPYVILHVRHNAPLAQACQVHVQVEAK